MPDSGRKDLIPMKRPLAYITAPWSENEFENENVVWLECSNHTTHFSNFMPNIQPKSNFILPKIGIYFGYAKHLFDSAGLSIIFWHNSILFLKCSRKVAGLCITHKNRYLPNVHIALQ